MILPVGSPVADASPRPSRIAPVRLSGSPKNLVADATTLLRAAWRVNPRRFGLQLFFLIVTGVIGGFNLLLLVPIVNSVAGEGASISIPLFGAFSAADYPLWLLLTVFVVIAAVQALISRAAAINSARFQPEMVDELRQQTFDAILDAEWQFVLTRRRSDMINIVTTGASRCGLAFQQLMQGAVNLMLAIATFAVSLLIAPMLTLVALGAVGVLSIVQATAIAPSHKFGKQLSERSLALQSVMQDSLESLRLIRAHNAADRWSSQLNQAFASSRDVQVRAASRQATVTALANVALAVAASILVLAAVGLSIPVTTLVVLLVLLARLARLAQGLARTATQLANALPAVSQIAELTESARNAREIPVGQSSDRPTLDTESHAPLVEYHNVSYTYPNSQGGVRNLDFIVPRGEITVLTGESGAGKSTTADLALGLLFPEVGELIVDGEPLTRADLNWWRKHVAYVPQEIVLIPASLRENLTWSLPENVSDDQCWEALDRASAAFASSLPDGLDTPLGDRGLRLSGGERQRVAIARALLRTPTLLVLDEATSSLDDQTEEAVLGLVSSLVPSVTVLVIAHRKSTVDAAQNVVVLHSGSVASTMYSDRLDSA